MQAWPYLCTVPNGLGGAISPGEHASLSFGHADRREKAKQGNHLIVINVGVVDCGRFSLGHADEVGIVLGDTLPFSVGLESGAA